MYKWGCIYISSTYANCFWRENLGPSAALGSGHYITHEQVHKYKKLLERWDRETWQLRFYFCYLQAKYYSILDVTPKSGLLSTRIGTMDWTIRKPINLVDLKT